MGIANHFKVMADYHLWAYACLLRHLEPVDDDEYRRECGLYFKSIHGTLNHLLLGDLVWYGRFVGEPLTISGLDQELCSSRDELAVLVTKQAQCWIKYVEQLSEDHYSEQLAYKNIKGNQISLPVGQLLSHVFNHGTHHRGQISAVITQCGHSAPEMDLVYYLI